MAEKEHKEQKIGSQLPGESIKVIAESVGISGIPDDAASVLAEDSSYRLKQIAQVCRWHKKKISQILYKFHIKNIFN